MRKLDWKLLVIFRTFLSIPLGLKGGGDFARIVTRDDINHGGISRGIL